MGEQQQLDGTTSPQRDQEPSGDYSKKYAIPKFPEYGQLRVEDQGQSHLTVLSFGSPVMLPDGKVGRILQDIPLNPELVQAINDHRVKTTARRIHGTTVSNLLVLEIPRMHFIFVSGPPRDFMFYLRNSDYKKKLTKREGEIQVETRNITTKDPDQFDPVGRPQGVMHLYAHRDFVRRVQAPRPVR